MKKKVIIISAIAVAAAAVVAAAVIFLPGLLSGNSGAARDFGGILPEVPITPASEFDYEVVNDVVEITEYKGNSFEIAIPDTIDGHPVERVYLDGELDCVILPDSVKEFELKCKAESVYIPASAEKYSFGASSAEPNTKLETVYIAAGAAIPVSAFANCQSLETVYFEDGVKAIGDVAFSGCTSIKKLEFPKSLESIGNSAFSKCSALTELTFPEGFDKLGYTAFSECTSLTKVTFPESMTSIPDSTFYMCSALTDITFGSNITELGSSAFAECGSLVKISMPEKLVRIGNGCFQNCVNLEEVVMYEGVKSIGSNAFYGCGKLKNVTIPDSLAEIGENAFDNSSWLDSMGDDMIVINDILFKYSGTDTEVVIPDGITSISAAAFQNNTQITSVKMPDTVTSIGAKAFAGCTALSSVTLSANLTEIPESLFYGCTALVSVVLPDSITVIGNGAFSGCTILMIVIIPVNVTEIGDYAFSQCSSLINVEIPESVTSIGTNAFAGCTSLVSMTIKGKPTLGSGAFSGCTKLANITVDDSVLDNADSSVFEGCVAYISNPDIWKYLPVIPETSADQFEYKEADGGIVITGYNGSSMDIRVPDKIGGKPVVKVDIPTVKATELILPDTVKEFNVDLSALKYLNIPENCTKLPVFGGVNVKVVLVFVYVGDGITALPENMFADCKELVGVRLPDSVKDISDSVFNNCDKLTEVSYKGEKLGYDDFNGPKPMSRKDIDTICDTILHINSDTSQGIFLSNYYVFSDINDANLYLLMDIANVPLEEDRVEGNLYYYSYDRVEEHIKKYVNPSFDIDKWKKNGEILFPDEDYFISQVVVNTLPWDIYPASSGCTTYIIRDGYSIGNKYYLNVVCEGSGQVRMLQGHYDAPLNSCISGVSHTSFGWLLPELNRLQLTFTKLADGSFQIESITKSNDPADTATYALLNYINENFEYFEEYGTGNTIEKIGVIKDDGNGSDKIILSYRSDGFGATQHSECQLVYNVSTGEIYTSGMRTNGSSDVYYDNERKQYVFSEGSSYYGTNITFYSLDLEEVYSYDEGFYSFYANDNPYAMSEEDFNAFGRYYFDGKQCTSAEEYEKLSAYYKNRFTKADDVMTDCSEFTLEEFIQYIGANLN